MNQTNKLQGESRGKGSSFKDFKTFSREITTNLDLNSKRQRESLCMTCQFILFIFF